MTLIWQTVSPAGRVTPLWTFNNWSKGEKAETELEQPQTERRKGAPCNIYRAFFFWVPSRGASHPSQSFEARVPSSLATVIPGCSGRAIRQAFKYVRVSKCRTDDPGKISFSGLFGLVSCFGKISQLEENLQTRKGLKSKPGDPFGHRV